MDIDGVVLESRYAEFQFLVKGPLHKVWRDGYPVDESQIIPLQFDRYLCELDTMARNQEWGEDHRQAVAGAIERSLNDPTFNDMWLHEAPKPPLPWPTYNETHHNQIPVIAQATGMVEVALNYEEKGRPEGPRPSVQEKLRGLLTPAEEAEAQAEQTEDMFAV